MNRKKGVSLILVIAMLAAMFTVASVSASPSWTIKAVAKTLVHESGSTEAFTGDDCTSSPANVIDGRLDTHWHSYYTNEGSTITSWTCPPHDLYIDFGETKTFSGIRIFPRKNEEADSSEILAVTVYVSDTATDSSEDGWYKIKEETFEQLSAADRKAQIAKVVDFGENVTAKKLRITVTQTVLNRYATVAEIELIDPKEEYIPASFNWTVTASDYMGTADRAIDGNLSTVWHCHYDVEGQQAVNPAPCPHEIYLTLPNESVISGLTFYPRADQLNQQITSANVYVAGAEATDSPEDTNWVLVAENATFAPESAAELAKQNPHTIEFLSNVPAKKVRFEITGHNGSFVSFAEIGLLPKNLEKPKATREDYAMYLDLRDEHIDGDTGKISKGTARLGDAGAWAITVNDVETSTGETHKGWVGNEKVTAASYGSSIFAAVDGINSSVNKNNYWHSYYEATGGSVTYHSMPPYTIDVTLPFTVIASQLLVDPRADSTNGCPLEMSLWVSGTTDGDDFIKISDKEEFDSGYGNRVVDFAANLAVRRFRLLITSSVSGYCCISEMDLMPADPCKGFSSSEFYEETLPYTQLYEISKSDMEAWADPSETWLGTHPASAVIDGIDSTVWQTISRSEYKTLHGSYPDAWNLYVDLGEVYTVSKLLYVPRSTNDMHGLWRKVNIYTSMDNASYTLAAEGVELAANLDSKMIKFNSPKTFRYIQIEIVETEETNRAACGELYFYQTKASFDRYWEIHGGTYGFAYGSDLVEVVRGGSSQGMRKLDGPVFVRDGWTYIPIDSFVDYTYGSCERIPGYDLETYQVTMDKKVFTLQEKNLLVPCVDSTYGDIVYTLYSMPIVEDGVFYVPLRFICKLLAYDMTTDPGTESFTITKKDFDMRETVEWTDPAEEMELVEYVVRFDTGDGEPGQVTVMSGAGVTLPEPEAPSALSIFRGWYEPSRVKRLAGMGGDSYVPTGDITLYASFAEQSDYEVAYATAMAWIDAVDLTLYYDVQKADVEALLNQAKTDLAATDQASTVGSIMEALKANVAAIETKVQLDAAKAAATAELSSYKKTTVYRTAQQAMVKAAKAEGTTKIGNAVSIAAVTAALAEAKAAVDAIPTDKEMSEEEDKNGYTVTISPMPGGSVKDGNGAYRNGNTEEAAGTAITLNAIPEETGVFKAWLDTNTKKVLSEEESYNFNVYTSRKITALFADHSDPTEHFVTFMNRNKQYIATDYLADGADSALSAPDASKMYSDGYTFTGWDKVLGSVYEDVDYVGRYSKDEKYYRIVIENGKNHEGENNFMWIFDRQVTIAADEAPAGMTFAGWMFGDTIVSYQPVYTFYAYKSLLIKATYAEDVTPVPLVEMINVTKAKKDEKDTASFLTAVEVPEGYTRVESGVLYAKTKVDEANLVLANVGKSIDGKEIKRTFSVSNAPQYKLSASYGERGITARGYLVYLDGENKKQVIYTEPTYVSLRTKEEALEEDIDLDD